MPAKRKKKTRRPRGDGSFYQRKSDGLFIGAVYREDEYGESSRVTVSSMDEQTAWEEFRKLRAKVDAGTYRPTPKMTLGDWLDYWVREIVTPSKAPRTRRSYSDTCKNQIKPLLGEQRLPITPAQVRTLLRRVGDQDGWGERTVQNTYVVLNIAMERAVKEDVISKNPCKVVDKPKVTESDEEKALTSDQARKVLLKAAEVQDPMVTRWAMAFLLGTRQAETLGLEWDRVDIKGLTLDLSWQLQSLETYEGASLDDPDRFIIPKGFLVRPVYRRFALTRPKSQRSKRLIPLPEPLAAILKKYRETTTVGEYNLVWTKEDGTPVPGKYDSDWWHAALSRAKVPDLPLHAARHTTATLLQEMGVEESVRMQIMGHSSVAAQRRYAHLSLDAARKALGNLDSLLVAK